MWRFFAGPFSGLVPPGLADKVSADVAGEGGASVVPGPALFGWVAGVPDAQAAVGVAVRRIGPWRVDPRRVGAARAELNRHCVGGQASWGEYDSDGETAAMVSGTHLGNAVANRPQLDDELQAVYWAVEPRRVTVSWSATHCSREPP